MLKGAIARRYAQAIFDIGRKQNTLDRTLDDVQEIARLFAHRTLAYLLREPNPVQRKETAIRQALASKVLPTSLNLALLVVQRELVDLMQNIARELEQLVLDYKNQARAEVTTATQIDDAQLALVKQALERRTGKTILLQTNIEPAILGGVIARVGDQVIDGSVKRRLTVLQQQLLTDVASSSSADLLPATDHTEQPASVVSNGRDTTADAAVLTSQEPETDDAKPKQQAKPRRKQKK